MLGLSCTWCSVVKIIIFANNTAALPSSRESNKGTSKKLQSVTSTTGQIKLNGTRSDHVNVTVKECSVKKPVIVNNNQISYLNTVQFLDITPDGRLHWKAH